MLEHGGNLREAAARYGRPIAEWLDLSTGLNPVPYPAPVLPEKVWHRLPEDDPGVVAAACSYYGAPRMLAVAGTQQAIQALPRLRARSRIVVSAPSYAEHAHCWRQAGHAVREVPFAALEQNVDEAEVMVVCNPNNPTGATVEPERLLEWAGRLAARGGWLVVDEAFGDVSPQMSVAQWTDRPGLIVFRSVGKFFGLAGLRLGFVAADAATLSRMADWLGPWSVSAPAQLTGRAALEDRVWQEHARHRLQQEGARLQAMLAGAGIHAAGTALFRWWPESEAEAFHLHMAEHGIWVRLFADKARGIRLGLPPDESGWQRLQRALDAWKPAEREQR
ncbi:threonine-phosphate decarboxylase CobD [Noviherbaspirillum denitrificans]|uniref:threonine-phosphate decarboxylase n=1 Tax=Noviherbaspirillum denitrificans TaxID=1968433 RepID=A0A254TB13_9BURK|nr:threonine-phosphate decarboxylase CobD [Noviherbaspirillum denitrificans]OWW19839.1 threonine-phosphate decarboxylase [Noviherbaspirillum denitrificans]